MSAPMFSVKCVADGDDLDMSFVPMTSPVIPGEWWCSTDGTLEVHKRHAGWIACHASDRAPLGQTVARGPKLFPTKEDAAKAACDAWVRQSKR